MRSRAVPNHSDQHTNPIFGDASHEHFLQDLCDPCPVRVRAHHRRAEQRNAAIFFRTAVVVAPVTPVIAAPVVAAPVVAAPVVTAPVVAAPVVIVPMCRFVAVPVVNAWTGVTYMVSRRVCN